jgi:hypothetical protein
MSDPVQVKLLTNVLGASYSSKHFKLIFVLFGLISVCYCITEERKKTVI